MALLEKDLRRWTERKYCSFSGGGGEGEMMKEGRGIGQDGRKIRESPVTQAEIARFFPPVLPPPLLRLLIPMVTRTNDVERAKHWDLERFCYSCLSIR